MLAHTEAQSNYPDYLDSEYRVTHVLSAQPRSVSDRRLRTLVVKAVVKDGDSLIKTVAIKISPAWGTVELQWASNELRIHYLLAQMDAESVRNADDADRTFFRADNTLEHVAMVDNAIRRGKSWSIVPLFDFAVRNYTYKKSSIVGTEKLSGIQEPPPSIRAAYATMMYFDRSVLQQAGALGNLSERIAFFRDSFGHVAAVLHQLLAISFTHGDLKAENLAWLRLLDDNPQTLWHQLAADKFLVLENQKGCTALFDFGFARAKVKDATNRTWNLVPTKEMIAYRFGSGADITPLQTFAPVVDLYRMVESICGALSTAIVGWGEHASRAANASELCRMMRAVLGRLPREFVEKPFIKHMQNFVTALETSGNVFEMAGELRTNWDRNAWASLYTSLPKDSASIFALAMPGDVLEQMTLRNSAPSGGIEMTVKPLIGKGLRYLPNKAYESAEKFRIAPTR